MKYSDFPWSLQPCYWLSSVPPFKSCKHPYRGGRQKGKSLPSPSLGAVTLQIQFLKPSSFSSSLASFVTLSYSNSFFFVFLLSYLFSCLLSLFPPFDFPFPPFFALCFLCSAALPAVLEKTQVIPFTFNFTFILLILLIIQPFLILSSSFC